MGNTLTSPHGGPVFTKSPMQTVLDFNTLRAFVETVGNSKTGTTSERTGLTGLDVWPGLLFLDNDLKRLYMYDAVGGWVAIAGQPTVGAAGHAGLTPDATVEYLTKDHRNMVEMYWTGTYSSGLADGSLIGSLPAGFRPPTTQGFPAAMAVGGTASGCYVQLQAGGNIIPYGIGGTGNRQVSFYAKFKAA